MREPDDFRFVMEHPTEPGKWTFILRHVNEPTPVLPGPDECPLPVYDTADEAFDDCWGEEYAFPSTYGVAVSDGALAHLPRLHPSTKHAPSTPGPHGQTE